MSIECKRWHYCPESKRTCCAECHKSNTCIDRCEHHTKIPATECKNAVATKEGGGGE